MKYLPLFQLLRVRIQLSALYFLQFLLSQPPAKFTFFPGDSYQIALGEQKHLNKIVDALIRKAMKKNKEVLDLITVIKTKQAIRMAAQTLEHTIVDLQKLVEITISFPIVNALASEGHKCKDSRDD